MGQQRFSGQPQYILDIDAAVASQNQGGNFSTIYWRVIVYKESGSGFSGSNGGPGVAQAWPSGAYVWNNPGPFGYNFVSVPEGGFVLFAEGTFNLPHDSAGNASYGTTGSLTLGAIGSASAGSGTKQAPRIPKPPAAPSLAAPTNPTASSLRVNFTVGNNNGAAISRTVIQWSTSPTFATIAWTDIANVSTSGFSEPSGAGVNLQGGTVYYVRARSENAAGTSGWSNVVNAPTLGAKPALPSLSLPTISSLRVAWTAVSGAAVTSYDVQYATSPAFGAASLVNVPVADGLSLVTGGLAPATSYYYRVRARTASGPGAWSDAITGDTTPRPPSLGTPTNVTTTSFRVPVVVDSRNGEAQGASEVQWSTEPDFSSVVATASSPVGGNFTAIPSAALSPGTTYYVRARQRSGSGWSAWSGTLAQSTLPASAPGMAVTPSASGTSAAVGLTPPGGVSGVTKYRVERRRTGTTTPVTAVETATNSTTVTGLTPGVSYEWRASAFIGDYQSPWTAWTPVFQPNPNVTPGDYFDGSTPAKADVTYSWAGATNLSQSLASGRGVIGWTIAQLAGSIAALQQIAGGVAGAYAARVIIRKDATAAGVQVGQTPSAGFWSEVVENAPYVASLHVRPSRSQRKGIRVVYLAADGVTIVGDTTSAGQVCAPDAWTRINFATTAPATARYAVIRALDVGGTGWSLWQSGEWYDVDAAALTLQTLFPYFDGSTPDTAAFRYDWLGAANASASTRTQLSASDFDPLADPDCPPLPMPPAPPVVANDCVTPVGTWRRQVYTIQAAEISEWLEMLPTIWLTSGGVATSQIRLRIYPEGVDLQSPDFISEQVVTFLPANTQLELDAVSERAWASVAGGDRLEADQLLIGMDGAPATWPVLGCGRAYSLVFDTPLNTPAGNVSIEVGLTQRMV